MCVLLSNPMWAQLLCLRFTHSVSSNPSPGCVCQGLKDWIDVRLCDMIKNEQRKWQWQNTGGICPAQSLRLAALRCPASFTKQRKAVGLSCLLTRITTYAKNKDERECRGITKIRALLRIAKMMFPTELRKQRIWVWLSYTSSYTLWTTWISTKTSILKLVATIDENQKLSDIYYFWYYSLRPCVLELGRYVYHHHSPFEGLR